MSGVATLSRVVSAAELPSAPLEIVASEAQRSALMADNDLLSVDSLTATVEFARAPGGAIVVSGRIVADVVQTCVVSLVPVLAHIDESFSDRFVAGDALEQDSSGEVMVDPSLPDAPELFNGQSIDVGALVEEHFLLALDPYPRAPGAALPVDAAELSDGDKSSPFAALAGFAHKSKDFDPK